MIEKKRNLELIRKGLRDKRKEKGSSVIAILTVTSVFLLTFMMLLRMLVTDWMNITASDVEVSKFNKIIALLNLTFSHEQNCQNVFVSPSTYNPVAYFPGTSEHQTHPISKINLLGDPTQTSFDLTSGGTIIGLKNIVIQFTTLKDKYFIPLSSSKHYFYQMTNGADYVDSNGAHVGSQSRDRRVYIANLEIRAGKYLSHDFLLQMWTEGPDEKIVACQSNMPYGVNKVLCRNLGVQFNFPGTGSGQRRRAATEYGIVCPLDD